MSDAVLNINHISKSFGAVHASQDVSLSVQKGEIHALIGPNGAGKSTIIGQIAGSIHPDEGTIELDGKDITSLNVAQRVRLGLGRSFQVSAVIPLYTVEDNILLALLGREQQGFNLFSNAHKKKALVDEINQHATRVRLENRLKMPASDLSHGERRRLELAMALALKPKVFLLDEPMAGLGNEGANELTSLLSELKQEAPILLVEHDMDAVFALADRISVLVYGKLIATGSVEDIRTNKEVRHAYLGEEDEH
jgi:branched-chain amino acid transport system ATP-binding protein